MTVPPNTAQEIADSGPPGFFINLDSEDDTLTADDGEVVAFGPQILVDWEEAVDFVLAWPSVASALTLRQTVLDEPDLDEPLMDFQVTSRGIQRGHNELLARLRAVVEETPAMKRKPIIVHCEGSGAKDHPWNNADKVCARCGRSIPDSDAYGMIDDLWFCHPHLHTRHTERPTMTRQSNEVWTCDSCGKTETVPQGATTRPGPVGWTCLAFNWGNPDPAWDHQDWKRFQLCIACRNVITNGSAHLANFTALPNRQVTVT